MSIIDTIKSEAISKYEEILDLVKRCNILELKSVTLNRNLLSDEINSLKEFDLPNARYIYLIKFNSNSNDKIINEFNQFVINNQDRERKLNLSRFNSENKENDSQLLYVGTSKSIKSRLKQHLGFSSSNQTYALHLKHWFPSDVDIQIDIIEVSSKDKMVFEAIEQAYWDKFKPLFGKRSGL